MTDKLFLRLTRISSICIVCLTSNLLPKYVLSLMGLLTSLGRSQLSFLGNGQSKRGFPVQLPLSSYLLSKKENEK